MFAAKASWMKSTRSAFFRQFAAPHKLLIANNASPALTTADHMAVFIKYWLTYREKLLQT
jgi:hypothetical protein